MARSAGDTWDLASGVGATATAAATSRALAHRATLIDDPWAEPLVKAVDMEMFLQILDGQGSADNTENDLQHMAQGMAVRTRYFDGLGWHVTGELVQELFEATGFENNDDDEMAKHFTGFQHISATLG
ncbi:class I SAM-dependent methyltransferase [Mycolicibacterium sarraceniae]|uniref:Uncharacterized protein n=1 Tax=Mycolicibacterium sarraceniae TaxID=1534348 RepID=A0A7I7SR26_9MYCO|nr:class I SAM-dependent methyltransferase [Mycolicibacterium sarraceniae]BBY59457.1 hypothetical protein MSAR_25930 [Mycolicibacterium sarraceniae]